MADRERIEHATPRGPRSSTLDPASGTFDSGKESLEEA